jgi:hypothetical protein
VLNRHVCDFHTHECDFHTRVYVLDKNFNLKYGILWQIYFPRGLNQICSKGKIKSTKFYVFCFLSKIFAERAKYFAIAVNIFSIEENNKFNLLIQLNFCRCSKIFAASAKWIFFSVYNMPAILIHFGINTNKVSDPKCKKYALSTKVGDF